MPNEIELREEINALLSPTDIEMLIKFEELEARVKTLKSKKNKALIEIFDKYGIKEFKNDNITITKVDASKRKVVDTEKLKADGLYDLYIKETDVKESIRMRVNYEED